MAGVSDDELKITMARKVAKEEKVSGSYADEPRQLLAGSHGQFATLPITQGLNYRGK
jgi:hypothetical protein